jgi:hypothetical protein
MEVGESVQAEGPDTKDVRPCRTQWMHMAPCHATHRVTALEDSQALDVFSPIRIDWLTGKDDYLRR